MSYRSRTRTISLALALVVALAAGGAAPSIAGTVYAVLSLDQSVAGATPISLTSEVVISNPLGDPATVSLHYIHTGADGVDRPEDFLPPEFVVLPGQTRVFSQEFLGSRGMIEIGAPSLVAVSARLVSEMPDGTMHSTQVPVVGSEELIRSGQFFVINGLMRDASYQSSLGIVNLSSAVNNCLVQLINPGGAAVIGLVNLPVAPRSSIYFEDAILAAGGTSGMDVRVQALCANDAYAYSVVLNTDTGAMNTLRPATDGASSLRAPGTGLQCETGSTCFSYPGTFFVPSPSVPFTEFTLSGIDPNTTFRSVRIQMSVFHNGWSNTNSGGYHGFFWFYRNGEWHQTFGYYNVRGPNRFRLINEVLFGVPNRGVDRTTADIALSPGQIYHVDYIYNAGTGSVRSTLLDDSGNVLSTMIDGTRVSNFQFGNFFKFYVGLEDVGFVETTTYGWRYMDGLITFTP